MIDLNHFRKLAARPRTGSFLALFLFAGLLAFVTPLRAANPPTYLFQIDSSSVPGGFGPINLALDTNNNIYVIDADNSRVDKFASNGAYLIQWSGFTNSLFASAGPNGVAVDSSNNVYVVNQYNDSIEKFDGDGNYLMQFGSEGISNGQFNVGGPTDIAVDSSNNVYVVDTGNNRVEKFDNNGNYLAQWGSQGSGVGEFDGPEGIAVDSRGNIYVADSGNYRIEKFNSSGNYLSKWGSSGSGNSQFSTYYGPVSVAVDTNNNVYVVDEGNHRMMEFNDIGVYLTQWGGFGSGDGQFSYPQAVAVDDTGNYIYVADTSNFRIQVFVNNTNIIPPFITQQPTNQTVPAGMDVTFSVGIIGGTPLAYQWSSNNVAVPGATNATLTLPSVALTASGDIYSVVITNSYGSALSSNAVLTILPATEFLPPTYLFEIDYPPNYSGYGFDAVALDTGNNVYVADVLSNRIVKYTHSGAYQTQWGSLGAGNGQFQFITSAGIAVGSGNEVYVTDFFGARVEKFNSDGGYLTQWGTYGSANGQFGNPTGIAVDSSDNVYVVDNGNARIEKFNSGDVYLTQLGSYGTGNGQYAGVGGIAVDGSKNVYIADDGNYRIEKFDDNGNYLTQWGSYGTGNGQFGDPQGIAVDSSNYVYVADLINNCVQKFTGSGAYLTQWGSPGAGNSQFNSPTGIAVDSAGNFIYVVDYGNNRIQVFANNTNVIRPFITQQPTNQTVPAGSSVSLNAGVVGGAPFFYQWTSNNVPISGATNATLSLTNLGLSDSATYAVLITNSYGSVLSSNAMLVVAPVVVTTQPVSQIVFGGVTVTLSVGVDSVAPVAYQWSSNTIALSGATNATFSLTNVNLSDAATYSVLISNSYGSVLSSNAVLTVLPVIVVTQPATGVFGGGAVLNGSVTLGPDDTVVWFDWGTNTNYGNMTGTTNVPGDSESTNISVALSGLADNVYHYRIDASNIIGIVYGNDQSFAIGSVPTATTLFAVNSRNSSSLNASVNPNGLDTKVYFRWGISATNSTPSIDIGAGTNLLNVSSLITGLTPGTRYLFGVVASNYLGSFIGAPVTFLSPPFTGAPLAGWQSVASSADGTKIVAGAVSGSPGVYTSTNSGATWAHATTISAEGVASSADGTVLVAGVNEGPIFISTNSGANWKQATNAPFGVNWNSIAMSASGTNMAAVAEGLFGVYTSTNSGANWTFQTNGVPRFPGIDYIASSADGSKLVAAAGGSENGPIFTSTNFGLNWTQSTNAPLARWYSVASSADGMKLAAGAYPGNVYLSTNSGATWTESSLPTNNWNSVASSADGTKLVALANSGSPIFATGKGGVFTSTDSGATWVSNNVQSWAWTCAAMSADGNEIIATIGNPSSAGGIYVSQTTPAPQLNIISSAGNLMVSWLIPSMNFDLKQNSDLSTGNWTDTTNLPVLNLTNLQNQLVLPAPDGNVFFRLEN